MNTESTQTNQAAPLAPVRHTVTVDAPVERAFEVFTAGFDRWWPRSHHTGKAEPAEFLIEGKVGGRCYERGVDGVECDWGRVRAWEPPARLVIAWHLGTTWQFDPDPSRASEVEVRFVREGDKRTRVELEHRHIERHGPGAEAIAKSVGGAEGWPGIVAQFARVVATPS